MKKYLISFCIALSLFAVAAPAQTPAPAPADTAEAYWTVSIHGQYSDVSGAATNNGTKSGADLRVAQHWSVGADYYTTISPSSTKLFVFNPNYLGLTHLLQKKPSQFINLSAFEAGCGPDIGFSMQGSAHKLVWGGGCHVDRNVGNNLTLRLLDVHYLRAPVLPDHGQVIGNHVAAGAGLNIRF